MCSRTSVWLACAVCFDFAVAPVPVVVVVLVSVLMCAAAVVHFHRRCCDVLNFFVVVDAAAAGVICCCCGCFAIELGSFSSDYLQICQNQLLYDLLAIMWLLAIENYLFAFESNAVRI